MILFLASELMFFGGLFAAYFTLRGAAPVWPPRDVELDLLEPSLATLLFLSSSATVQASIHRLREGNIPGMRRWLLLSLAMGAVFLGAQLHGYSVADFEVSSHAYGSLFYTMTGFHGLHVLAGLVLMVVVLGRSAQGAYERGDHAGPEAVAYYWHFVDVVWLGLFSTIYLLR
jgi:cytochrome c oxidase subunit 3